MAIKEAMLPEFEHEMATTRLLLERVPLEHADWRPHPKSMPLGRLAAHLVEIPTWVPSILEATTFDTGPSVRVPPAASSWESRDALLDVFDANVATARAAIEARSDADFLVPWSLLNAGEAVFTLPRAAVLRTFLLNHLIHHRGQLTVYLRLRDVPLPRVYGATADEA